MEKVLDTPGGEIPYTVIRGKRRSISLKFHNAQLIVAIPRYSLVNVDRLLKDHMNWIVKHYIEISNSKNLLTREEILLGGVYHRIEFSYKKGHSKVTRIDNKILVESENRFKAMIAVLKFARQLTEEIMVPMVENKLRQTGRSISEIKFRRMKKWGYCTSEKKIRFNAYLSMMPHEIIDYVASHEVSHLVEMNHSKKFWKVVESLSPNYKILRKELKRHNINDTEMLLEVQKDSLEQ